MFELSLHILDIVENSLRAQAEHLCIKIYEDLEKDELKIVIEDDGQGMDEALKEKAVDPFTTTKKKKKKIGLGLPLFRQIAQDCGGCFSLESESTKGTTVFASMKRSHIDRPPLGDMAETIQAVISGHPEVDLTYEHVVGDQEFVFDTVELKQELEGIDISHPKVVGFIKKEVKRGLDSIRADRQIGSG